MRLGITKNILRLDISVADSFGVDVSNRAEQLVAVKLDNEIWHHLFHLEVVLHNAVCGVLDVIHDDIQVNFVRFITICIK